MTDADRGIESARRPGLARRLLVITYHFPPDGAVGGLRWSGLSKYLARLGWEVHVITASELRSGDQIPGVERHYRPRRRTLNDLYNAMVGKLRPPAIVVAPPAGPTAPTTSTRSGRLASALKAVRIAGGMALTFPDDGRGWVLRAGMAGRALLKRLPFDAVITSGPPHSAHFAGMLATLNSAVPHIIDMRDPWRGSSREWHGYAIKSRVLHALFGHAERLTFRRARDVLVNTREYADEVRKTHPHLRVTHIPNGTDVESLPVRDTDLFDGVSVAYAGTVYLGRSFSSVFDALVSLLRIRPDAAGRVKLRIAGSIHASQTRQFESDLAERGLTHVVEIYGVVPRTEALELLRRSHLALVLAQAQPTQVPAKLYECVGLGVPTLVVAEDDSAASREARRIGAMTVTPGDTIGMRSLFEQLLDDRVPHTTSSTAQVSYDEISRLADNVIRRAIGSGVSV